MKDAAMKGSGKKKVGKRSFGLPANKAQKGKKIPGFHRKKSKVMAPKNPADRMLASQMSREY